MKTLFFIILIFIMLFLIYGNNLFKIENMQQDILSMFRKNYHTHINKYKSESMEILENHSEISRKDYITGDPEIDEELEKMRDEQIVIMNPIVQKLLYMNESDLQFKSDLQLKKYFSFNKYLLILLLKIKSLDSFIVKVFITAAGVILLLMLFVYKTPFSRIGLLFANFGYKFSRVIIFITSVITVIVWFSFEYNFFDYMGIIFLASLLSLLISSVVSLKIYDYNNPIWNRTIYSILWPMSSGIIIQVF